MPITTLIVPLAAHHDRKAFTCGEPELDDFLRQAEPVLSPLDYSLTRVLVYPDRPSEIVAFYTLAPDPVFLTGIPADDEVEVVTVLLKYLAVDTRYQRQGVGEGILLDIIEQIIQASDTHPSVEILMLYALHDKAKAWYLSRAFGFQEVASGSPYLVLPVETMRQALR